MQTDMKKYKATWVWVDDPNQPGRKIADLQCWSGDWLDSGHTGSGRAKIAGKSAPTFVAPTPKGAIDQAKAWVKKHHS